MVTKRLLSFAVLGALTLAGCSDSNNGEPIGSSEAALNANDKTAFYFFVGKGLTNFQAAGIVGNLDQESNDDPTAVQYGGGPGRGIAQWSVGGRWDTYSGDNATAYASKMGESVWSLNLQLEFIWYELTSFSSYGLSALKATTNVTDATVKFMTDFEGCGVCDQTNRINYAQAALNAYGSAEYGAQFVGQSFPFASTTMTMEAGQVIPSYIELKNVGTKTWDSNTRIGTTMPRDRTSAFADSSWVAPNRPSEVKGTVAPGASYKFLFNLTAPSKPGTYDEHFGVVEEGVAWFSDTGQGGPPDDQLEVKILVVPSEAGAPDSGATHDDGGSPVTHDGGSSPPPNDQYPQPGGCSVGQPASASGWGGWSLLLVVSALLRRRAFDAAQRDDAALRSM